MTVAFAFVVAGVYAGGRQGSLAARALVVGSDHRMRRAFVVTPEMIATSRANQEEVLGLWMSKVEAPVDEASGVLRRLDGLVVDHLERAFFPLDTGSRLTSACFEDQMSSALVFGGIERIGRVETALKARIQRVIKVYDKRILFFQQKALECSSEDDDFYLRMLGILEARKRVLRIRLGNISQGLADELAGI